MKIEFNGSVNEVLEEVQEFMEKVSSSGVKKIDVPVKEVKKTGKKTKQEKTETVAPGDWTTSDCKPSDKLEESPEGIIPTVATEYTLTDVVNAAAQLVRDKGEDMKLTLRDLLAKYNVKSLQDLSADNYGAVMEELKNLGADV